MSQRSQPRTARQRTRQLDDAMSSLNVPQRPRDGWVSAVRQALGMSQTQLAKRMGIAPSSIAALQKNETNGGISLARLQRAADALDCDLQYVLVPREPLAQIIATQARRRARQLIRRVNESQALEDSAMPSETLDAAVDDLAAELALQRPSDLWND